MIDKKIINLFTEKLDLSNCDQKLVDKFWQAIEKYLNHGRKEELKGRTSNYLEKQLDKLINFLEVIEYSKSEMVYIISEFSQILNIVDDLYEKYLFLAIVENPENTLRKEKLLSTPKDFMVNINQMYAKYKMIYETCYYKATWSNVVHSSNKDFLKIFVKGKYKKNYQLFEDIDTAEKYLYAIDTSDLDIEQLKQLPENKEIVAKYEKRSIIK